MSKYYDIVIIGGGIAGLYSAYTIKKLSPDTSFVLLERDRKEWIGGRMGNDTFYGASVVVGAGIGRKKKDKLLIKLLKELCVPTKEFDVQINYAQTIPNVVNVQKIIDYLKGIYEKKITQKDQKNKTNLTFSQFAKKELGPDLYNSFIVSAGYTDYEKEDVYDVLYDYGWEDNMTGWKGLSIPWKQLVLKLCDTIGWEHIKYKTVVIGIQQNKDTSSFIYDVYTNKLTYRCKKIIVATNINGILKLVPGADQIGSLYRQIHGQPFVRVYAKFPEKSAQIMKSYVPYQTIVPGPLHKIIPMSNDVYMIAYSDNEGALYLKGHLENTAKNRHFFEYLLEISLGIPENTISITSIKDYYWSIGTHYYGPLDKTVFDSRNSFIHETQHPGPNILVVGEVVSSDQGWTEGALESVHSVLNKKWIMSGI